MGQSPLRRAPAKTCRPAFQPNKIATLATVLRTLLGTCAVISCVSACAPTPPQAGHPKTPAQLNLAPVAVSEERFAESTYRLLVSGDSTAERSALLEGVVERQLYRAQVRFDTAPRSAGFDALRGAFYLLRAGEFRGGMLQGSSAALAAGAAEVARRGYEGYAYALYTMLQAKLPPGAERREVEAHLEAMARFSRATHGAGPLQAAGAELRASTQRALLEPTKEALDSARDHIIAWLKRALERDEAFETYRAQTRGGYALVALYLRHGDARGALQAADRADLGRIIAPEMRDRLERAATEADSDAWADLYQFFDSGAHIGGGDELVDTELMAGAAWGAALELFRTEPGAMRGAVALANELIARGMAEVAPLVLAPAAAKDPTPENVSLAMGLTARALVSEDELGQLDSVRRLFDNAEPLLRLAESQKNRGRVNPSASRLRYVMGALETRHGELTRALPLIHAAAAGEPSVDTFMMLAAIERQRKEPDRALQALAKVVELARAAGDPLAESDALSVQFEVYRDRPDAERAIRSLEAALARALDAERNARSNSLQARAERLLARILEHYGDSRASLRATERAYRASSSDARQLTATVLDAARRALTREDLRAARNAAQRAVEAGLGSDDVVYVALWLQLLEKKLNVPSDGTVEEAYATIDDGAGWPVKLRAWARGKLSDEELTRAAHGPAERTEALFYSTMAKTARSGQDPSVELEQVASSSAIDLVEVTIARDLLALRAKSVLDPKLPQNLNLP
jgi:cellulose synthase operon protein C